MSVGMALAERWLAHRFNRPGHEIVDHCTYAFCSDGDLMEGISHEAAALAGHQKLGKLIWIWDDNHITIEGDTGPGHVHRPGQALRGIRLARRPRARRQRPRGHGPGPGGGQARDRAPHAHRAAHDHRLRQPEHGGHGRRPRRAAGPGRDRRHQEEPRLSVPGAVLGRPAGAEHWRACVRKGERLEEAWRARFGHLPRRVSRAGRGVRADAWPGSSPTAGTTSVPDLSTVEKADATRNWSGKVIQGLAGRIPNLVGGSADLAPSNKTDIEGADSLLPATPGGRIVHFGIREHAMGAVHERDGAPRRRSPIRRHVPDLLGLHAARPSAWRRSWAARDVRLHPRLHRPGRGRPDAPARRAARGAAGRCPTSWTSARQMPPRPPIAWRVAMERRDGSELPGALPTEGGGPRPRRRWRPRKDYAAVATSWPRPAETTLASSSSPAAASSVWPWRPGRRLEADGIPTRVVSLPSWFLFRAAERRPTDIACCRRR